MSIRCSYCSLLGNHKKFYSKFIGSIDDEAPYYCDDCYNKHLEHEELLVKFAIKNGENIADIVKQEKIIDFINPASSNVLIKPMNIYKIVTEVIEGSHRQFVMIDMEEYNNYMMVVACSNKKLIDDEKIKRKKEIQQKQESVEKRKIEAIHEKEKRDIEKELKVNKKIELEIKINRHNNEKIKQEKEEIKEQYKEVFKQKPESIIKKCDFCKLYRVFPYHYKDENNKSFFRPYTKDKRQEKAICCVDCFEEYENKKEDKKLNFTSYCNICNSSFIAYTNELYVKHLKSTKHKKNESKLKGNINLSLMNVKELNKICSRTIDEKGLYRINNYSKIKKEELIQKMNDIYDLLIFD